MYRTFMKRLVWLLPLICALFFYDSSHAAPKPHYTNSIGMEFTLIPAGSFMMGANPNFENADSDEVPQHEVTIGKPFYLGTYEVTQAQWVEIMGANPSSFKDRNRPVEQVSWSRAQEFIRLLNEKEGHTRYRLPTEAEWEYAARAGTATAYCFGDHAEQLGDYAWYDGNSDRMTHPVGQKKPNPWGLHDMYGNVQEWVQDWYAADHYTQKTSKDPHGPSSGIFRSIRGGCWYYDAQQARPAARDFDEQGGSYYFIGLRLVLTPEE